MYAFTRYVTRDGYVFTLTAYLVYFVNINYALLRTLYITIGGLDEFEKNIYMTKLIESYDSVKELAIKDASEIALNKQSFSLNSELLNVSMMTDEDAKEILFDSLDMVGVTLCYLGAPISDETLYNIINE